MENFRPLRFPLLLRNWSEDILGSRKLLPQATNDAFLPFQIWWQIMGNCQNCHKSSSENEFDLNVYYSASLENVVILLGSRIGIVFQESPAVIESLLKSLSDREVANCALVCKSWRIYAKKILDRREKRMCTLFGVNSDGNKEEGLHWSALHRAGSLV